MIKKERRKTKEEKINNIYISSKQYYLKFWSAHVIVKSVSDY